MKTQSHIEFTLSAKQLEVLHIPSGQRFQMERPADLFELRKKLFLGAALAGFGCACVDRAKTLLIDLKSLRVFYGVSEYHQPEDLRLEFEGNLTPSEICLLLFAGLTSPAWNACCPTFHSASKIHVFKKSQGSCAFECTLQRIQIESMETHRLSEIYEYPDFGAQGHSTVFQVAQLLAHEIQVHLESSLFEQLHLKLVYDVPFQTTLQNQDIFFHILSDSELTFADKERLASGVAKGFFWGKSLRLFRPQLVFSTFSNFARPSATAPLSPFLMAFDTPSHPSTPPPFDFLWDLEAPHLFSLHSQDLAVTFCDDSPMPLRPSDLLLLDDALRGLSTLHCMPKNPSEAVAVGHLFGPLATDLPPEYGLSLARPGGTPASPTDRLVGVGFFASSSARDARQWPQATSALPRVAWVHFGEGFSTEHPPKILMPLAEWQEVARKLPAPLKPPTRTVLTLAALSTPSGIVGLGLGTEGHSTGVFAKAPLLLDIRTANPMLHPQGSYGFALCPEPQRQGPEAYALSIEVTYGPGQPRPSTAPPTLNPGELMRALDWNPILHTKVDLFSER